MYKYYILINMEKIKIIHLINADTTGGVEVGAKLGQIDCQKYIDYEIKYIYDIKDSWFLKFVKLFKAVRLLLKETKDKNNQNLLSSLWMSHIVSLVVKILSKNITWISFIHNSNYSNKLNYLICKKLTLLADKQVFDSYTTSKEYNDNKINQTRIVNYLFENYNLKYFDIKDWSYREFDFIIVARNVRQKGFLELENFCMHISDQYPSLPKFMIITNDSNRILDLNSLKRKLKNICEINFKVNLTNSEVLKYLTNSKIYFCLSHFEGFGITIVEALLSGCFIITTNVGEQKNFLYSDRRLILSKKNNYSLDFKYIFERGKSRENFNRSKEFLFKNVNKYAQSLVKIIVDTKKYS